MEGCLRFVVEVLAPCPSLFEGRGFSLGTQRLHPRIGSKRTKPDSLLASLVVTPYASVPRQERNVSDRYVLSQPSWFSGVFSALSQVQISSIKGEVKKNTSPAAGYFLALQPVRSRKDLFWPSAPETRLVARCGEAIWFFHPSGFILMVVTTPFGVRNEQAGRLSGANHGSIRDSWSIAFSGYPREHRVGSVAPVPEARRPNFTG